MTKSEMFDLAKSKGVAIHSRDNANYFLITTIVSHGRHYRHGVQTYSSCNDYPDDLFDVNEEDFDEAKYDSAGNNHMASYVCINSIPEVIFS